MNSRLLLLLALIGTVTTSTVIAQDKKPLEWKSLLIIKVSGKIKAPGFPDVNYQLSKADIVAVRQAFTEYTADLVDKLSGGRANWKPTIVESTIPLMAISKVGEGTWVAPSNVADDIKEHAKLGEYDSVFVYWKDSDDGTKKTVRGGFGWSIGPTTEANGSGYSCVNYVTPDQLTRESEFTEVFIHEWLHQLEAYYGARGIKLPKGGLHGNANYGFKHQNGWKHWYQAFLCAELKDQTGLGERAWRLGTIRAEMAYQAPAYLTPERRRRNLLKNGNFEIGQGAGWNNRSFIKANTSTQIQSKVVKDGRQSLMLRSPKSDDLMCYQAVQVKPYTRYLLAGWIKTEDIVMPPQEKGRNVGANLSLWIGYETSQSLTGTNDWKYATLVFDTKEKNRVEVGGRLGHHSSMVVGTAWFDDLVLIELPPSSSPVPVK